MCRYHCLSSLRFLVQIAQRTYPSQGFLTGREHWMQFFALGPPYPMFIPPIPHRIDNIEHARRRTRQSGVDHASWVYSHTWDNHPTHPLHLQLQIPAPYSTTGSRSPSMWAMPIARRYDTLFSRRCFTSNPHRKADVVAAAAAASASVGVKLRPPCSWRQRPCNRQP
jgi:hypothetical protein